MLLIKVQHGYHVYARSIIDNHAILPVDILHMLNAVFRCHYFLDEFSDATFGRIVWMSKAKVTNLPIINLDNVTAATGVASI